MSTIKEDKKELEELKQEIKEQKQVLQTQKKEAQKIKEKIKNASKTLRTETKKQVVVALMAAFGFLIALVWRDLLQELSNWIVENIHLQGPLLLIKLYIAILTTGIAVIGIILVTKWNKEAVQDNN